MDRATLDRLVAKGFEFDQRYYELADMQTKYNLEREEAKKKLESKQKLSIRFVSLNQNASFYFITFTIESKNLLNRKGFIFLNDIVNSQNISFAKVTINKDNFSQEFKFPKSILNQWTAKAIAKIDFIDIEAESKQIPLINEKKTCYCNRDFTVDEMENIVIELRENTYYNKETIYSFHKEKLFYRNNQTKDEYVTEVIPENDRTFEKLTYVINKAFKEHKINNCIEKISFLAQMYIETNYYTATIELTHLKKNYEPYRGRGFIQLTHKGDEDSRTCNSTSYLGYSYFSKLDVITTPSIISKSIHISADSACWFWTKGVRKLDGNIINLNTLCGEKENEYKNLTEKIKGSTSEFKERYDAFKELLKIMNYEKCSTKK